MQSPNDDHAHIMNCLRVEMNEEDDLEFEFECPDCGYAIVVPLIAMLASQAISISHLPSGENHEPISVTYHEAATDVPEVFQDFIDRLS